MGTLPTALQLSNIPGNRAHKLQSEYQLKWYQATQQEAMNRIREESFPSMSLLHQDKQQNLRSWLSKSGPWNLLRWRSFFQPTKRCSP